MADFVDLGIAYGKRGTSLGTSSPPTSSEQHPYLYFLVCFIRFLVKNNQIALFKILKKMLVFKLKIVIIIIIIMITFVTTSKMIAKKLQNLIKL